MFLYWDHNIDNFVSLDYTFDELDSEEYLNGNYYEVVIWYDISTYDWGVYLHDFDTSLWDKIYSVENNNWDYGNVGWDMYEAYYDSTMPTPYLRASEIMVYLAIGNGYWQYNGYTSGSEINSWSGLTHGWSNYYYDWNAGS